MVYEVQTPPGELTMNSLVIPAQYPTSFAECDKWEFFANGKPISIQQCYDMVKRNKHFPNSIRFRSPYI